jgi:archaellum component FlaC
MTRDSSKGTSGKSDDVLVAILKRLNAMNNKLQTMDAKLHAMEGIKDKVHMLEESTNEL